MPFCANCGAQHSDTDKFCFKCGYPVSGGSQVNNFSIDLYWGNEVRFDLMGETLVIPKEMDAFNYYRKKFKEFAKIKANDLRGEYCATIRDLDSFLVVFPEIYAKHRKPLLDAAMDLFCKADIYDVSAQQFEESHTADFCLCGEDVDIMIDSFNKTIEANQDRKINMYNMMPGMVFRGLGGFAAALAVNVAVHKIAEADIRNANVTPAQRMELFGRINFAALMERAFLDYWRVFLSFTYNIHQRGLRMWYPTERNNTSASGLFQNLVSGRVPADRIPSQIVLLLSLNPYQDQHKDYLIGRFGRTPEINAIVEYFGYEQNKYDKI